jgi:hypothetical protein
MMKTDTNFDSDILAWKQKIVDQCDAFAKDESKDLDLDFYVFQSAVSYNPELLIIGANPGGNATYSEVNLKNNRERRTADQLGYSSNQFIENPTWGSGSLNKLFSGPILAPIFERAIVTNVAYFNTENFAALKKRNGAREAINFCKSATLEMITIVQPQRILLLGNHALDAFRPHFEKPAADILKTSDVKSALVRQSSINGVPVFWIHHPSRNQLFNSGENLEKKRTLLESIFSGGKE